MLPINTMQGNGNSYENDGLFYCDDKNCVCRILHHKKIHHSHKNFHFNGRLLYSTLTISEIAWQLKFNDPSHFVNFFKKSTPKSPAIPQSRKFTMIGIKFTTKLALCFINKI